MSDMPEEIWVDKHGKRFDGNFDSQGYFNGAACYLLKSTVDAERVEYEKVIKFLRRRESLLCELFDVPYEQEKETFKFDNFLSRAKQMKAADRKTIRELSAALEQFVSIGDLPVKKEVQKQADKTAREALSENAPRIAEAQEGEG